MKQSGSWPQGSRLSPCRLCFPPCLWFAPTSWFWNTCSVLPGHLTDCWRSYLPKLSILLSCLTPLCLRSSHQPVFSRWWSDCRTIFLTCVLFGWFVCQISDVWRGLYRGFASWMYVLCCFVLYFVFSVLYWLSSGLWLSWQSWSLVFFRHQYVALPFCHYSSHLVRLGVSQP